MHHIVGNDAGSSGYIHQVRKKEEVKANNDDLRSKLPAAVLSQNRSTTFTPLLYIG